MALDFPNSPSVNQVFTAAGQTWTWDGTKWLPSSTAGGPYVPLGGGTMTGALVLSGDPQVPLGAVTKQYVDDVTGSDNRIINGNFIVDQRNGYNPITPTANQYSADRWVVLISQSSKISVQAVGLGTGGVNGTSPYIGAQTAAAFTPATADAFSLAQGIEYVNIADFNWGTANAQPVTLSFYAQASIAGTYAVALLNNGNTRSYVATFTLPAGTGPSNWTKIALTIPGDPVGAWAQGTQQLGLTIRFPFGAGATYKTATPNQWLSGFMFSATGAVDMVATASAVLRFANVKLELGSSATPFNFKSYGDTVRDCQRYYTIGQMNIVSYGAATQSVGFDYTMKVIMRANPTTTVTPITNSNCTSFTVTPISASEVMCMATVSATGSYQMQMSFTCSAELI